MPDDEQCCCTSTDTPNMLFSIVPLIIWAQCQCPLPCRAPCPQGPNEGLSSDEWVHLSQIYAYELHTNIECHISPDQESTSRAHLGRNVQDHSFQPAINVVRREREESRLIRHHSINTSLCVSVKLSISVVCLSVLPRSLCS